MTEEPSRQHLDARGLVHACFDSLDSARKLLDLDPAILHARDGLGETALHYLAVENQLEAVKFLFEGGATLNTVSDVNGSPLSEAASLGYEELVAWLLANGAEVDLPGQGEPTLIEGARSGNARVVELILLSGASVATTNGLRETALHMACSDDKCLPIVELLLAAGADIGARRIFDETPLDVAVAEGAHRIATLLRSRGAPSGEASS